MKAKGFVALLLLGFSFFYSCTKLNEPTEIGDELIPAVDNVNTFDTTLYPQAGYFPFSDTSKNFIDDVMALGRLNDPVFGTTNADMYFNLSSTVYNASPFYNKDSLLGIDSVVLQLSYAGAYGDTTSQLDVEVAEITKTSGFADNVLYRFDQPGFATGAVLGTATFSPRKLRDSISLIRRRDTTKVANVLRVRLNNSIGQVLSQFDTTGSGPYKNDSLFRAAFRGLAVKTNSVAGLGALTYFNLFSNSSGLVVYYRVTRNGVPDTASAVFQHSTYSQANSIMRTAGGEYLANFAKPTSQQLYIQSSPQGSYTGMNFSGLTTFPNKIIHRAELIAYRLPSALDNIFTPPTRLFLDHKGTSDTSSFLFDNDIPAVGNGSFDLGQFGGNLRIDNSYRFNITRYVQGIVTRGERNDSLRLYAPLRTAVFSSLFGQRVPIPVAGVIANGRVVIANANHPDANLRLRLRIIYSNL